MFKNWSAANIVIVFKEALITGFADDTFCTIERDEDAFTPTVGAEGDVVRNQNLNKMGTVTVMVLRESTANQLLSQYAVLDEATGIAYGQMQVKDLNGTLLAHSEEAWIQKLPSLDLAKETAAHEWVFRCAKLELTLAGANF